MRLDDQIMAIYNEIPMQLLEEEQANWMHRNINRALVRAKKLEQLADAVEAIKQNPERLAPDGAS